jgi:hypothetical protein
MIAHDINDPLSTPITALADEEALYVDNDKRSQFNTIFYGTSVSPLKSSVVKPLEQQSESSLRRLTAKYKRGIESLQKEYADAMAPNQGEKLIRLAETSNTNENHDYDDEATSEIVERLKLLHEAYVAHKVPFQQKVQLVSDDLRNDFDGEKTFLFIVINFA